ncbi:MAG TPA: GNAT family protein [Thermoanaerobaculia bacterium]|nr:GNAT family protein [Thermoanaerobaculia bacterium]
MSPLASDLRRMLDPAKNPLFLHAGSGRFYTAHRGGEVVGRIVAHVHHASNARHGLARSCFGFFDCADDVEAARALLGAAEAFGRSQGCTEIAGNFNLTAMQQIGVVTAGFENAPYTDQVYNPPHVPVLLAACGYAPIFPMRTVELDLLCFDPETLLGGKSRAVLADRSLRWETLRRRDVPRLLRDVRLVLNDGFDRNPMFVPLTDEEFLFQAADMMWIVDPRISALVHGEEGPAGVVVCIPDLNPLLRATGSRLTPLTPLHYLRFRWRRRRAVIIFYSVARARHGQGLNGAMLYRVTRALKEAGYETLGITWIADENAASLRQIEKLGARELHRLHLFRKEL